MKSHVVLGALLLVLMLSACGKQAPDVKGAQIGDDSKPRNSLWDAASPDTSVLGFSVFDGKEGFTAHAFEEREEILALLKAAPARRLESIPYDKISFPVYGAWMGTKDGEGLYMIWTNGILITRHGEAYEYDFDWESLAKREWKEKRAFSGLTDLFGSYYLVNQKGSWNYSLMKKEEPKEAPAGIKLEILQREGNSIKAKISNEGTDAWAYGEYFSLSVSDGSNWYEVPPIPTKNWGFYSIGYELAAGGSQERSYGLLMFGELPAGKDKLNVNGCEAEFDMP